MWLIVCSSFSPQGHVELGIILNLWKYDLVKPWPVTIAINSAESVPVTTNIHAHQGIRRLTRQ